MLKKNNYTFRRFGATITVPTAYAMVEDLKIKMETGTAKALFRVKAVRDLESKEYIDEFWVNFPLIRDEHFLVSAYRTAKGQHYENKYNEKTEKVEKVLVNNSPLFGWDDDIV